MYTAERKKRLRRAPATRKKVVSNFIKQQMGRIIFLNPPQHCLLVAIMPP
jgi:hypothetical protein